MTTACSACGYAVPVPDKQKKSTVQCPRCGNVQPSPDNNLSTLELLRSAPGRSVPMTIRGKNMLMTAEFDRAARFFNETLKSDPADAEAYWGLLLANHQCRDDNALIDLGVCIEKDENFALACRVGSDDEKSRFKECAKRSRYACHLRFMDCLFAGNYRAASLRAALYLTFPGFSEPLSALEKKLLTSCKNNSSPENTFLALEEMSRLYEGDKYLAGALDTLKHYRAKTLDKMLALIYPKGNSRSVDESRRLAKLWANCKDPNDGKPSLPCDRYMFLAKRVSLLDAASRTVWAGFVCELFDSAAALGADADACTNEKNAFLDRLEDLPPSAEMYKLLIKQRPNGWRPYLGFVLLNESSRPKPSLSEEDRKWLSGLNAFGFASFSRGDEERAKALFDKLANESARLREYPEKTRANNLPYLNKATDLAPEPQKVKAAADKSIGELRAYCEKEAASLDTLRKSAQRTLDAIIVKKQQKQKEDRRKMTLSGHLSVAFCLSSLAVMAFLLISALLNYFDPARLLPYNVGIYATLATVISLAAGAVLFFGAIAWNLERNGYRSYAFSRALRAISAFLVPAAAIGASAMFIAASVHFNNGIGTIEISGADDISYIKKHNGASFMFTSDIDLTNASDPINGSFHGTLDGNGHAVRGITGSGEYWIEENEGTIKNIRFEDLHITGESFSLIGSNKQNGQIIDCTVSGVTSESADAGFSGIVHSNNGVVRSCSVTKVRGEMKNFAALVYENLADSTVAECSVSDIALTVYGGFSGAFTINKGSVSGITVSDVELSGTPDDDFEERDIAGICIEQTDKAHIENCSVSRLTVRDINVRSLAGICVKSGGEIKNCRLSEANISAGVAHYFGGIAGEAQGQLSRCSVDGIAIVTVINRYPTDETPCPIIGGIAGWQADDISYSCSTLSFDIKSKIYYDAVRLFAGGISGSISEGINITRTYFSGDIHIECGSTDGTPDDTNRPSEADPSNFYHKNFPDFGDKCLIGGIYGSVKWDYGKWEGETAKITECFTDGSIEFVTTAGYSSASKPHIYTGGLTGITISKVDVEITDSYSAMNIYVSLPEEDGNSYGYAYVGGLNPYFGACAPHLKNCFFAGTISASKIENSDTLTVWGVPYDFLNGYKDINSYFREDCGFNVIFADDFIVPNEQFMSADFIHNTMLWEDDAWQITDGALPVLKNVGYRENDGSGTAEQ